MKFSNNEREKNLNNKRGDSINYSPQTMAFLYWTALGHPCHTQPLDSMRLVRMFRMEGELRTRTKNTIWLSLVVTLSRTTDGEPVGRNMCLLDISMQQVWFCMSVIWALRRPRQDYFKFESTWATVWDCLRGKEKGRPPQCYHSRKSPVQKPCSSRSDSLSPRS